MVAECDGGGSDGEKVERWKNERGGLCAPPRGIQECAKPGSADGAV